MKKFLHIALLAATTSLFPFLVEGQESLSPLLFNPVLQESREVSASRESVDRGDFRYEINEVPLPFIDDFSTNRIKRYQAKKTDANVSLSISYDFTVDGLHPETFSGRFDTTFNYTKLLSGEELKQPNPALQLIRYEDREPKDTQTVWTNIETYVYQGNPTAAFDTLPAQITLVNSSDTVWVVADDQSLWTTPGGPGRGAPFINNTFPLNPPSQGVATFDGLDAAGVPWNFTSPDSYGNADTLESKPLLLDSTMVNVALSFFYQAGGLGNLPDPSDSLVLEFYSPVDSSWSHAWSTGGLIAVNDFDKQVFLPIEGAPYLRKGFKFRFRNLATLSAGMDHWHIDYVRVDEDRDTVAERAAIEDIAIVNNIKPPFKEYSKVPYAHYFNNPSAYEADSSAVVLYNLNTTDNQVEDYTFKIKTDEGQLLYQESTFESNVPVQTPYKLPFLLESPPYFIEYVGENPADFILEGVISSTGANDLLLNDTIRVPLRMGTSYAYDDGSAEQAYGLTGAGAMLAYEFETAVEDTLESIVVNFPQVFEVNQEQQIKIMVWKDLGSSPFYESELPFTPVYSSRNSFARFELLTPLRITGKFYIGFEQVERDKVYVGFDANTNSMSKIHYNADGEWRTSEFKGSLLLRPDFGFEEVQMGVETIEETAAFAVVNVYPNPANHAVNLRLEQGGAQEIKISNLNGQILHTNSLNPGENLNVATHQWAPGFYIVQAMDLENGRLTSHKLLISR